MGGRSKWKSTATLVIRSRASFEERGPTQKGYSFTLISLYGYTEILELLVGKLEPWAEIEGISMFK